MKNDPLPHPLLQFQLSLVISLLNPWLSVTLSLQLSVSNKYENLNGCNDPSLFRKTDWTSLT